MNPDPLQTFAHLFEGNPTAYGSDTGSAVHKPVTDQVILRHLEGTEPIGIYPCRHVDYGHDHGLELQVKWGCCDIDTGDWSEAYALWSALRAMGIASHVERSRSKGWHIWVFADSWVPAATMRRALKVAYKAIDLPAKEANPKSEFLRPGQLGNYVRLPYKGHWSGESPWSDRQVFMVGFDANSDGKPINLRDWLSQGGPATVSQETLAYWSTKWYEPPRPDLGIDPDALLLSDALLRGLEARLSPSLRRLWATGPKNEHKRSEGLVALAHQTARAGFTPQEVFALVSSADKIWGKYSTRPNGQIYLMDIVERAFR